MYHAGELVMYGVHGVCKVAEISHQTVSGQTRAFYVLVPVHQDSTRFLIPCDNPLAVKKMRPLISKEDLESILQSTDMEIAWIDDENTRKQVYRGILSGGNQGDILKLVITLDNHRMLLAESGKKFHLSDQTFLNEAKKILDSEFSAVLEMDPNEVAHYVKSRMGK